MSEPKIRLAWKKIDKLVEAGKWINAQTKLSGQILKLGAELGITPGARRALGLGRR